MSKRIVISQPYYFPWYGFLDLVRNADIFVFYDDVQYSKGGFMNRVQVKTPQGFNWITVPVEDYSLGQKINVIRINNRIKWKEKHLKTINQYYSKSPFFENIMSDLSKILSPEYEMLSDLTTASVEYEMKYFKFHPTVFISSELNIGGCGSERVLSIIKYFECDIYITAMGALRYLDFKLLENNGIETRFIDYMNKPYRQLHGDFNPFVTALDLFMNCGAEGIHNLVSETLNWNDFIGSEKAKLYKERFVK